MITRIEKGLVKDLKEKDGLVLMIHRDDLVVDAALLKFCVKYQDINSEG